jgi:dTDP-4-amino-4,6-dideoxygalactose transaminase
MIKFLDLAAQYQSLKGEIDEAISLVIADTAFIGGKYAGQFEEEFAAYLGANFCVGVGNGTDALEIAIEALVLPAGSEIVVPANSFIASSEAVTRAGHRVVFADCDNSNYTLSPTSVREKLTPNTSAVMPVHLYGHPCDMDAITGLAKEFGLKVIEDCAQAHGAEYRSRRIGTLGDVATFSFYPGKNLGAYGDAGAIVTQNGELAQRTRMIANHGRIEKYNHEFEGRNSRLDGIQAAVLSVKLRHLEASLEARRAVAATYRAGLSDCKSVVLPIEETWARHVYHLFVVRTERRDELKTHLEAQGIQTGIHYPISLPKLKAYRYCGQYNEKLNANAQDKTLLSLPIGDHLSASDVEHVIGAITSFA